ncbi:hypothetical protein ACUS6W_17895 [Pseudomonas aeruginosa]|jgi:hypothetical protein|uniref:hypothetical protein n=1 Tax=Pseudomonas aeruginosa TaxID=287 RepID=UPI0023B27AB1|nr:hypothetical protein [Pseudomonas aeruginosa]MDE9812418.1 hypothetical protein [Pseudomonas aeruginosa]
MQATERLDLQAGSLAALEGAFALLVGHLANAGALNRTAFMADLHQLSELPGKEAEIQLAEQRLLRMLAL